MDPKRSLLIHFLGALAYRTQKALRGAPEDFGDFRVGHQVRTPKELVRHMDSVLGYARTFAVGGEYRPPQMESLAETTEHFHAVLRDLARMIENGDHFGDVTPERLLQGPFSDAMTHAGQLAMLRRLAGNPVPPENFVKANVSGERLGRDQPEPADPDDEWPEAPPE